MWWVPILLSVLLGIVLISIYIRYIQLRRLYNRTVEINDIMVKVTEEIDSFKDIKELYRQVLKHTIKLIGAAEYGSILIYDQDKDIMEYGAVYGYNIEELSRIHLKKEELFAYKYNDLSEPCIIKMPESFDRSNISPSNYEMLKEAEALNIKSTLSAPIYIDEKFYGVINVDNCYDKEHFTKTDIIYIKYISRQLQAAIGNTLLMNELTEALRYDKLTGIFNRRYFEELMALEMDKASRYGTSFSLVMIDMDNFKSINDNYSHIVGDQALQYFAGCIKKNIRSSDIAARYAGDEFIIVFYHSSKEDTQSKLEDIRKYIQDNPFRDDISVKFSSGICCYDKGKTMDDIITEADNEMYANKREGKKQRQ